MARDIFPPLQGTVNPNPQGIIDAVFVLRPELIPEDIDKHEITPYSYSPYITTALYIEFTKSPAIKLVIGRVPNKQEPVLIDNYGTIYEFQVTKERSELGKFYKLLKLGKSSKKSSKDHVSIGLDNYLLEEELTIFYIPSQTDKDGDTIEECLTIFNANNVQGNFQYSYLLGKKHELINEVLRLITLKSIDRPVQLQDIKNHVLSDNEEESEDTKRLTEEREQIEELRKQKDQLIEQSKTNKAEKGKIELELIESQNKQTQLNETIETKDKQLVELKKLNDAYEEKIGELIGNQKSIQSQNTKQLSNMEEYLREIRDQMDKSIKTTQIENDKIMSVKAMIEMKEDTNINKLLNEIEIKYTLLNEEFNHTKDSFDKQLIESKAKLDELRKEKASLLANNKDNEKTITQLKTDLAKSLESINLMKVNFDSIQKDKSEFIFKLKESEKNIKQLEDENENLTTRFQELKFTKELKEQQLNILVKEKEEVSDKLEKREEKLGQYQGYNEQIQNEIQQLKLEKQILAQEEKRLKDLINDRDQRKTESISEKDKLIDELKESLIQKNHEIDLLNRERERFSLSDSDKKDEIKTSQQKLAQTESERDRLNEEREELQISLTSKEKELEIKEKKWEEEEKRLENEKATINNQLSIEQTNIQKLLNELNEAKLQLKKQETENNLQISKLQGDIKKLLIVKNQLKKLEQRFMAMSSQSIGQMNTILNDLSDTTLQTEEHNIKQNKEMQKNEIKKMEDMLSDIKFNLLKRIGSVS